MRTVAVAVAGVAGVVSMSARADAAVEGSSNRGGGTETAPISIENVFIVPRTVNGACSIQVGSTADLRYTVSNSSTTRPDRLVGITTSAARQVRAAPTPVSVPVDATVTSGEGSRNGLSTELVGLAERADPGKSFPVSFRFATAGSITVRSAVEACPVRSS